MRLIDADALKERIHSKSDSLEDLWDTMGVLNAINTMPTLEERPKGKRQTIFVVSVREEIDGEDVVYHRYFSSERKAETFINDNLKGQIVMSLSEEEVT